MSGEGWRIIFGSHWKHVGTMVKAKEMQGTCWEHDIGGCNSILGVVCKHISCGFGESQSCCRW